MRHHGELESVGIEGTSSYGAGVMRCLNDAGVLTSEVDRPDRSDRRRRGTSDAVDAEMAARAVISGRRLSKPKNKNGRVEPLRGRRLTRPELSPPRQARPTVIGSTAAATVKRIGRFT